jgi:uncharacterized protein (TIGR02186 family)
VIRILAFLLVLAAPAPAEQIVLGLSEDEVAITATFDGSDLLIFGAIDRNQPRPPDVRLGVVITVSGPLTPVTVRRKDRVVGVWMNTDKVEVDAAPSYYAVASTAPLRDVLSETEDLRHSITIPRAIRSVGNDVSDSDTFVDALIRIRADEGLYKVLESSVDFSQETLFHTEIALPANLTEGSYGVRIFLTRGGAVIDTYETAIPVRKVGIERWLFRLSREDGFIYGLMSLSLAVFAGWAASAAFQRLRR